MSSYMSFAWQYISESVIAPKVTQEAVFRGYRLNVEALHYTEVQWISGLDNRSKKWSSAFQEPDMCLAVGREPSAQQAYP